MRQLGLADPIHENIRYIRLFMKIQTALKIIFDFEYPEEGFYVLHDLFSVSKIWSICNNYDLILEGLSLDLIFGSEPLPSSYAQILTVIDQWKRSRDYVAVLDPSQAEMKMRNDAIAVSLEHQRSAQEARLARSEKAKQARGVLQSQVSKSPSVSNSTTGSAQKRKPPMKVPRGRKKSK
ncbi:hypothetical protein DFH28DRAFT_1017326, partial [Melampsora americana]